MTTLSIKTAYCETLTAYEGKECLVCLELGEEGVNLNAAQAAALVQYIALLLDAKEKDEEGNYQLLRDNQ